MKYRKMSLLMGLLVVSAPFAAQAFSIEIDGRSFMDVHPDDTFLGVMESITHEVGMLHADAFQGEVEPISFRIDVAVTPTAASAKVASVPFEPRDYNAEITPSVKADITFILRTLANTSLLRLPSQKSSLQKAGDRIDRIHPLKFLECVFTDEELKTCVVNVQGRKWVWKEFVSGLVGSFKTEASNSNIKSEHVENFVKIVNVNKSLIDPYIESGKWKELIEVMASNVERAAGADKYNM